MIARKEIVNSSPVQRKEQVGTLLLLDSQTIASLRRVLRTQRQAFLSEWHQHPLTVEQLNDNANIGKIEQLLIPKDSGKGEKEKYLTQREYNMTRDIR